MLGRVGKKRRRNPQKWRVRFPFTMTLGDKWLGGVGVGSILSFLKKVRDCLGFGGYKAYSTNQIILPIIFFFNFYLI